MGLLTLLGLLGLLGLLSPLCPLCPLGLLSRDEPLPMMILRIVAWLVGLALAALLAMQLWYAGQILWWKYFPPSSTSFMRAQLSVLREKDPNAQLKYQFVPYEKISVHLKRAVISAEDANFTEHEGVDWEAIEKAYEDNQKKGKLKRGGSTITMQLAKNLFLSSERSYWRKGQEVIITYMLETILDKERIFEIYLNVAEWGVGVFGVEAGARHYYGQSAAQLGPQSAAKMAVMLPRPRYYDKNRNNSYLLRRAALIGRYMHHADIP
jgi:monofunctional glycosyltransferase